MEKNEQAKGKIRLGIYAAVVGGFALAGLIVFVSSQFQRAKYSDSEVQLTEAKDNLEIAKAETPSMMQKKEVEYYSYLVEYFTKETKSNSTKYKVKSITSYVLTTLALVSFGVCLKIEDDYKAKEDK